MKGLRLISGALICLMAFGISSCVVSTTPPSFSGSVPICSNNEAMFDSTIDGLAEIEGLSKLEHSGPTNERGDKLRVSTFYRNDENNVAVIGVFNGSSFDFQLYEDSFENSTHYQGFKAKLKADLEKLEKACGAGKAVE